MKKFIVFLILLFLVFWFMESCSPGRWKTGTNTKLENMKHWKAVKAAKKASNEELTKTQN